MFSNTTKFNLVILFKVDNYKSKASKFMVREY
jgi:hypothetical protein